MKKFYEIKQDDNKAKKPLGHFADENALHVILWCPNLPNHYVMYDGNKYWMFNALSTNGWASRVEFKGHIYTLRVLAAYTAFTLYHQWDFKVRYIPLKFSHMWWGDYLKHINSSNQSRSDAPKRILP